MQGSIVAIELCLWIDTTAWLCKSDIAQLQESTEARKDPVMDPKSMAAFNFEKNNNTVALFKKWGGNSLSIAVTGVERTSLAEHT